MINDASRGFIKIGLKKTLTPREKLSVRLMVVLAASVLSTAAISAAISAKAKDEDVGKAVWDAVNPNPYNGKFASIIIGDHRVPIGGPYRAIFRAVYPQEVKGIPFPVPFAGVANYVRNRVNPLASTQIDLLQNKDYYGKQILKGDFLERLLRGVEYEVEGVLPLTAGTVAELGRQSLETGETMDWGETGWQTIGQFAGANVMKVNLRTQDALDRAMTKLGLAGATEANLKQRQARYEAYFEIPSDVDEVKANRKEFPYTRAEYLERYPDVEAKLFILGKISSFKKADDETYPGRDIALRLMIENKLTVDDIAGLKLPAYPSQAEKDRRRWFELELESQATAPVAPAKAERRLTPKGTRPKGYVPSFGR